MMVSLRNLKRGMVLTDPQETVVLFAVTISGGGVGMGQTPRSGHVVFSQGEVLSWDDWERERFVDVQPDINIFQHESPHGATVQDGRLRVPVMTPIPAVDTECLEDE